MVSCHELCHGYRRHTDPHPSGRKSTAAGSLTPSAAVCPRERSRLCRQRIDTQVPFPARVPSSALVRPGVGVAEVTVAGWRRRGGGGPSTASSTLPTAVTVDSAARTGARLVDSADTRAGFCSALTAVRSIREYGWWPWRTVRQIVGVRSRVTRLAVDGTSSPRPRRQSGRAR